MADFPIRAAVRLNLQKQKTSRAMPGGFQNDQSLRRSRLLVTVVADRFDRAAFKSFHAERNLVFSGRLFVNEGVAAFIVPGKKRRCRLATQVTVDALLIDKKLTRNVMFPFVCFIGHGAPQQKGNDFAVKR
jgi:hypothetical protein